jgi:hypothetical protein
MKVTTLQSIRGIDGKPLPYVNCYYNSGTYARTITPQIAPPIQCVSIGDGWYYVPTLPDDIYVEVHPYLLAVGKEGYDLLATGYWIEEDFRDTLAKKADAAWSKAVALLPCPPLPEFD